MGNALKLVLTDGSRVLEVQNSNDDVIANYAYDSIEDLCPLELGAGADQAATPFYASFIIDAGTPRDGFSGVKFRYNGTEVMYDRRDFSDPVYASGAAMCADIVDGINSQVYPSA